MGIVAPGQRLASIGGEGESRDSRPVPEGSQKRRAMDPAPGLIMPRSFVAFPS